MKSGRIRVLLIEDSELIASAVRNSLMEAKLFELEREMNLTGALVRLSEASFDLILLELALPDSEGTDTVVRVRNECPDVPIVVLAREDNEATALHAIAEGAQDFVTKSTWSPASLPRILRFAVERHKNTHPAGALKDGQLLTFVGAKGGCGTTTVALNVAAALAVSGKLAIATEWCWPRGNFSLYLGRKPVKNLSELGKLAPRAINAKLLRELAAATAKNLMLLHGPQAAEQFSYLNPAQATAFVQSLQQISDFAIVDLPPNPTAVSRAAVRKSDIVCVVLEPTPESVVLANEKISMMQSWGGGDTLLTAVVVNKGLSDANLSLDKIASELHLGVLGVVPPSREIVPGFFNQIPLTMSRPGSLPGQVMIDIAQRLATKQLQLQPC